MKTKFHFKLIEPKRIYPHSGQSLVDVPKPEEFESPYSWLSRLALSQNTSIEDMLRFLDINIFIDFDLHFDQINIERIATICGLPIASFSFMKHMFQQLKKVEDDYSDYLLHKDGLARYRFCPHCLEKQFTPHLELHWRFSFWRWCPIHNKLMKDFCPRCRSVLILPINMVKSGRRGNGIAFLLNCQVCGANLTSKSNEKRLRVSNHRINIEEHFVMANGRTFLAALYHGHYKISSSDSKYQLKSLGGLKKQGYFPPETMRYEGNEPNSKLTYRHPFTNRVIKHRQKPRSHNPDGDSFNEIAMLYS